MNDKFEKLAKLAYKGAGIQAMCSIFNLSEDNLLVLMEMDGYKEALAKVTDANFEFDSLIDQGWDGIEHAAMSTVLYELKENPDPDFALRAAMAANKASRAHGKNAVHNNATIAVHNNMQTVIYVQPKFAEKLQDDYIVNSTEEVKLNKKVTNVLNPNAVKHLLGVGQGDQKVGVGDLFNSIPDLGNEVFDMVDV